MAVDGLLSLRWNNHSSSFLKQLSFLRDKETYSDLTLVCGGQFYRVHRLVVSGCSEYFRAILEHTPCRHPAVVLQDLPPRHLEALLSYMYLGHVSVPQDQLGGLIKAAECLAIKGLAVPDEATPTPTPPPHQDGRVRPTQAWEEGPPAPKRRRQDRGEAGGSPGPPPHRDDSGRSSRSSSRGSSPQQVTPSVTPQQNTSPEDLPPVIKVEEDKGHPQEVKCEVESIFSLPDPLGGTQQEGGHNEGDQAAYTRTSASTTTGLLHQYPPHSQAFDQTVAQALPGTSGMHEPQESGHGWDSGPGKGDLTAPPAFLMDTFTPQQEPLAPSHQTSLHQRDSSGALRLPGTAPQDTPQGPLAPTTLPMLPLPCTLPGEREGELGARVGREWRCDYPDCGYVTDRESWLKQHYRKHTGEKPFACPLCSFRSAQKGNVNVHIKRVHYGSPFHSGTLHSTPPSATTTTSTAPAAATTTTGPIVPSVGVNASKHALLPYLEGKDQPSVLKVAEWGV